MLSSRPLELGFESTGGQIFPVFSLASFFCCKIHTFFFRLSDLVICRFLVRSDSVRTAEAVVIMCPFTALPHVLLYSSTINNILPIAAGQSDELFRAFLCRFRAIVCSFCSVLGLVSGLMGS